MRRTMVQVIMIYALTKLPFVGFEEKSWTKLDGCMYMMKENTNCWLVGIQTASTEHSSDFPNSAD